MSILSLMFALQAVGTTLPVTAVEPKQRVRLDFAINAAFIEKYDKTGDGALNLVEYQDAMTEKLQEAIASNERAKEKMDAGKIAEFRNTVLSASFRSFDKNSDGRWTVDELPIKKVNQPTSSE